MWIVATETNAIPTSTCQNNMLKASAEFILYSTRMVRMSPMDIKIKEFKRIIIFHILKCVPLVILFSL